MCIAQGRVERQGILKSGDRFLELPCGCKGFPKIIPEGYISVGITLKHGLVTGNGFIVLSLSRELVTEVCLGHPISHRYIHGVLKKSDAVMPVWQLRTRKPGAKHQCNCRAESLSE